MKYNFRGKEYDCSKTGVLAILLSDLDDAGIIERIIRETSTGVTMMYFDSEDTYIGNSSNIISVFDNLGEHLKLAS